MKRILIDLDYTLTDGGYLEMLNNYTHGNFSYDDMKNQYFADALIKDPIKRKEYIKYMYKEDNVYKYAHLKEDAYEVMEKLCIAYDVYICSAYVDRREEYESGIVCYNKHRWLVDHLPFLSPTKFIFIGDKSIINTDVRIDDKLSNLDGSAELKIFIPAYYNEDIDIKEVRKHNAVRCNNWKEIEQLLLDNNGNAMI